MINKWIVSSIFVASLACATGPLDRIHFPSVAFDAMPAPSVLTIINEYAGYHDPQTNANVRGLTVLPIVPPSYKDLWTPRIENDRRNPVPTVSYSATNVSLRAVLDTLCDQADLRYECLGNLVLVYPEHYSTGPRALELIDVPIELIRDRFLNRKQEQALLKKHLDIDETSGLISLSATFREHGILTDPSSFVTYHKPSKRAFAYLTDQERKRLNASPLSLETPARQHIRIMNQTPFKTYSVTNRGAHMVISDVNRMIAEQHPDAGFEVGLMASNKEKLTRISLNLDYSTAYDLLQAFTRVTGWTLRNSDKGPAVFARTPADEWRKNVYRIHPALDTIISKEGPEAFFTSIGMSFPSGASIDYDRPARFLTVRNTRTTMDWLDRVMPRLNR